MMIPKRLSPTTLWIAISLALAGGAVSRSLHFLDPDGRFNQTWQNAYFPMTLAAYAIAICLCLRIRADYPAPSTMRTAWLLMALSSVVAVIRYSFEWFSELTGWMLTMRNSVVSLRQVPIVLSLLLLTAGLLAMWSSFASIGMGARWRRVDVFLLIVILSFIPSILSFRGQMADAQSEYPIIRYLQSASPLLLAGPALVGLALHRISVEMGGGQFAISLRYLVAFLLLRLMVLVVNTSPQLREVAAASIPASAVNWAVPWLFAMALAYRWRLTVSASELADRYERNPDEEIAELSQVLQSVEE
jgi:hypothetical protein